MMNLPELIDKKVAIIFRSNGVGLDQDAQLVKTELLKKTNQVDCLSYKSISIWMWLTSWFHKPYDQVIFLERVHLLGISLGQKSAVIPNQERFPKRQLYRLKLVDAVWTKTQHAHTIFSQHHKNVVYIGFKSRNIKLEKISLNHSKVFHLAGKSMQKGTSTIINVWKANPQWPQLTLVQHPDNAPDRLTLPKNIKLIADYLPENELMSIQNQCGIHLCTSESEGWGHYIHEAVSIGATIVLTDAPPMNELEYDKAIWVKWHRSEPRHLGTNYYVDENDLTLKLNKLFNNVS